MESEQLDEPTLSSRLALARALLSQNAEIEPAWPVVAAAAFFMVSAMVFAVAAISVPPKPFTPVPETPAPTVR